MFVSWATHNATIVASKEKVQRPDLDSIASQVFSVEALQHRGSTYVASPNINVSHRSSGVLMLSI